MYIFFIAKFLSLEVFVVIKGLLESLKVFLLKTNQIKIDINTNRFLECYYIIYSRLKIMTTILPDNHIAHSTISNNSIQNS